MPARRFAAPILLCLLVARSLAPNAITPVLAQSEPELVTALYGNSVTFKTLPFSAVSAELADAQGSKDQGIGVSGADGLATVTFFVSGAVIRPGDTITLSRQGDRPLRVTVPTLAAGIDLAADRVFGSAPAGAAVQVALTIGGSNPATIQRTVTADANGSFTLDLAGEADLQPGAVTGSASYTTAANHRFDAQFAALSASLTLGARTLRGQATPGTQVAVEVRRSDGSIVLLDPSEVTHGSTYTLALGGQGSPDQPAPAPFAAGDSVVVTQTGGPAGSDQTLSATLAAVTVSINASTDRIAGTAPAGTALSLSADAMDGTRATFNTTADAAGSYNIAAAGQADLGPGWRVRAAYDAAPGVRVGALAVLRKVRIGVNLPTGQGRAEPGRQVTVTLRSDTGAVKRLQRTVVNDQGEYSLQFGGGFFGPGTTPVTAAPGDSVEIAFVEGDPQLITVPALSARTDVAADTVSGAAPSGSTVRVRVDSAPGRPSVTAPANPADAYVATLSGTLDLARPANGTASFTLSDGTEFYTTWAAVQLTATLGNTFSANFVTGNGPGGRSVTAELLAPDGRLVGQASGFVFGEDANVVIIGPGGASSPQFFLQLADTTGTPVEMRPGDKLRVTTGDDVTELVVPPLDAVIFVQTDTVNGHSLPNAKVTVQIIADPSGGISATAEATADAAGNFSQSFAGTWDVKYCDFVQLTTAVDGHNILNTTIAPGMLLDLDQALLLGSLAPNIQATISLKRGTRTLSETTAGTDPSGAFATLFTDAQGTPLLLLSGDVITVTPQSAGSDPLTLTVPDLTITADPATDLIQGRATAGGALTMLATDAYARSGSLGIAQAWPALGGDNTYATDFVPRVNVRPGTRVFAIYRPPAGHYVARTHTVPILNAEHSGPNACGFGEARLPVTADLRSAGGATLASTTAPASFDGFFSSVLRDPAKAAVATATGMIENASLGKTSASTTLPPLDLQVDWQNRAIQGTGPANTTFYVQRAVPCPGQQPGGVLNINIGFAFEGQTGPDGSFQYFVPPNLGAPGTGLELALYAPNDHRVFRHMVRTLGRIFIHHERVAGRANPLDAVTVILRSAGGTERARAVVKADENGFFDVRLTDAGGKAVTIAAGDSVLLQAPTEAPEIRVEPLAFDWSPGGSPLVGQAPPGRTVQVVLRLASGQFVSIPRQADASGTFRFSAGDVPPRATWSYAEVVALRVVLETANGHQIIDQTDKFETRSEPGPDNRTVYLPMLYSGRRPTVGAQAAPPDAPLVRIRSVDARTAGRRWFDLLGPGEDDDRRNKLERVRMMPEAHGVEADALR